MKDLKCDFWGKKTLYTLIMTCSVAFLHNGGARAYKPVGNGFDAFFENFRFISNDVVVKFAVPVFFVLSGYLFFRGANAETLPSKLKRRLVSLGAPYLFYNALCTAIYMPRDGGASAVARGILLHSYNNPAWYLFYLLVFLALAYPFYFLLKNKYIGLAFVALFPALQLAGVTSPLRLDSVFWYLVGAWSALHAQSVVETASRKKSLLALAALVLLASAGAYAYLNGITTVLGFCFVGCWLAGWFALDALSLKLSFSKFTASACFIMYMLHAMLIPLAYSLIERFLPGFNAYAAFALYLLLPPIIYLICFAIARLITRSRVLRLLMTGGR